jgi:hypothetical protein
MDNMKLGKRILSQVLVMSLLVTACVPSDVPSVRNNSLINGSATGTNTGSTATGDTTTTTTPTILNPTVEIRHLIEPNLTTDTTYSSGTGYAGGGSYVRKLTLPKNFAGKLYVAGININTLSARIVKVRFKFGVGRDPITVPATVTQAPGITPATSISVLVLNLASQPFRNVRLPYDLFDYNEYDFANGDTPTQDNRNSELYCRGLQVADDPTFVGVGACDGLQSNPDQPAEECLYAYAKVLDQGLVKLTNGVMVPITPSLPQTKSITGSEYFKDYFSAQILKPLRDTVPLTGTHIMGNYHFSDLNAGTSSPALTFSYPTTIWDGYTHTTGEKFFYRGPYRLVNNLEWQFAFSQLDGEKRLFRSGSWVDYPIYLTNPLSDDSQTTPVQNKLYYNSYLFPLATQLSLNANVNYLGSTAVNDTRIEKTITTAGKTVWMDGANARAQSKNSDLEHVGSCNVSAAMEIIAKDDNAVEYVIATSKDVKLQLVRPTQYVTDTGTEVLYTNFKTCSSNASCGSSECCFNSRCWDSSLVSQCIETATQGNRPVGDACASDLQCSSLCCNTTSGLCSPHNTSVTPAVTCQKPIGSFCIAKEWCQQVPITSWILVKTGTNASGAVTCAPRSSTNLQYGECIAGTCTAPVQGVQPTFDTVNCTNAVTAPVFSN